ASTYAVLKSRTRSFVATTLLIEAIERAAVHLGLYHLPDEYGFGDVFDMPRSAWTYRTVDDNEPFPAGYAPVGILRGIAKAHFKMDELWRELSNRGVGIGIVVYPWPAQIVHDREDSRQIQIWEKWCEAKCSRFISVFPEFFHAKHRCRTLMPGCWYSQLY